MDARPGQHGVDLDPAAGEQGTGMEGVAAVVARPREHHHARTGDRTALFAQHCRDPDLQGERGPFHQGHAGRQQRLLGGPHLRGGPGLQHAPHPDG